MRRASKRLIMSIIALVASVILCIGVCLAWFAMNNEVSGNGMQTQVKSGDIVDFNVTAYYLNYETNAYSVTNGNFELNGIPVTVDYNNDKIINTLSTESEGTKKDVMRPYSVSGGYTTAVLFKVEYEIVDGSSKKFRIFAECDEDSRLKVTDEDEDDNFTSYLSNTVTFVSAAQSETASGTSTFAAGSDTTPNYTYTAGADVTAFVGGVSLREKTFHIGLKEGLEDTNKTDGENYSGTEYFIMDYEKERFTYISSLLLESGGGLNSGLTLTGDITLGIEEYIDGETVTPTNIAVDTLAYNYSTAYKQSMGNVNTMTPNWQFVVTYSDGSQKIIVGNNSNLAITGVTTTAVGTGTATATYKEGTADAVSCDVPYTIGLSITGASGVAMGETITLSATGIGDATVTWSSLNESVATVNENGVVTPVSTGTATIIATADGYNESDSSTYYLKAEYVIVVTAENIPVTGVSLNTTTLALSIGNKASLLATVAPTNATNKAVTWTSSDPTVATVVDGVVTALKTGETTITVTTQGKGSDGTTTYSASCTVTVSATIAVEKVTISGEASEIAVDGTTTLTATVTPSNATNKTVAWSSSNESVATVSGGTVTGVSAGTVTIYAEAGGKSASYTITVTGVKLDKTSATLIYGVDASLTLTATAYTSAESYTLSWATSNASVASISYTDNVCTVTPVAVSETAVTITVTLTVGDNEYTATCTVTVTDSATVAVTGVTLNKTSTSIEIGSTETLTATIAPADATNKAVTWTSSDPTVATVSGGVVTALKTGETTITVTTDDGGYTATCTVTVTVVVSTSYTVTFKNYDGSTLETDSGLLIDATPSYGGSTPTKTEDTYNTYSFTGWSDGTQTYKSTLPTVTGDVTYVAQFTAVPKSEGTVTYMYTYGGTNGSEWATTSKDFSTSLDTTPVIGLKITKDSSDTFTLTASGKKVTITMMGFTTGSTSAQPYVTVTFKDAAGKSLGTLTGTTTKDKLLGSYTFSGVPEGTFESDTAVTSIELTCNTTSKSFAITSVTIIIESESSGGESVTPTSIALDSGATTTFKKGSTASTSDWSFTVTYSDSSTKTVTASNVSIGTIDTSASGSVSVSYTENGTTVNTTVNYTVQAPTAITFKSGTQTFAQNVAASTSDWKFTVTYGSLGDEEVDVSAVTVGTIDTSTVGENQTVTVTLNAENTVTCTVTYTVTAAATGVADKTYTFSSANSTTNTNAGFTISGSYTSSANVTYNGTTYNGGLKMESSTSVKFTLGSAKTVRFVVGPVGNKIKIDGTSYTIGSGNVIDCNLAAGEHEITKDSSSTYLVLIIVGYEAVSVTSVTISGDSAVVAGRSITLTATVLPDNAEDKTVTWAIKSGSEYAEINSSTGVLTGKAQGDVVVTATAGGVTSEDFGVTVNAAELDKLEYTGTTSYTVSSEAVTPDWVFTATYSDGTTKTVTPTLTGDISGGTISIATAGDYTVTASYTENEITIQCTVTYKVSEASSGGTETDTFKVDNLTGTLFTSASYDSFTLTSSSSFSVATNYSTATADDGSGLTFTKGLLPSGSSTSSGKNYTITAKYDITIKVYYTLSDGLFSTKDQSKAGTLKWIFSSSSSTINEGTAVAGSNKVAYCQEITILKDDSITLYSSASRLVLFGIIATYSAS
ncbi:MAG: beta strand repeat-containing protein [Candidatus Coproplasma sp.]